MDCPECGKEMVEIELSEHAEKEYDSAYRCDNSRCAHGVELKPKEG